MANLAICAGCPHRKEWGMINVTLPPNRECQHIEACAWSQNLGFTAGRAEGRKESKS